MAVPNVNIDDYLAKDETVLGLDDLIKITELQHRQVQEATNQAHQHKLELEQHQRETADQIHQHKKEMAEEWTERIFILLMVGLVVVCILQSAVSADKDKPFFQTIIPSILTFLFGFFGGRHGGRPGKSSGKNKGQQ